MAAISQLDNITLPGENDRLFLPIPNKDEDSDYVELTQQERIETIMKKMSTLSETHFSFSLGDQEYNNIELSCTLSLADLKAIEKISLWGKILQKLDLNGSILAINKAFPFLERLRATSDRILTEISLFNLQEIAIDTPIQKSKVRLALISDEDLVRMSIQDLAADFKSVPTLLYLRLEKIRIERADLMKSIENKPVVRPQEQERFAISIAQISTLNGNELNEVVDLLPPQAFALLTDCQIPVLNFSRLSSAQMVCALEGGRGTPSSIERRIASLSEKQFLDIEKKESDTAASSPLGNSFIKRYFKETDLTKISDEIFNSFFPSFDKKNLKPGYTYSLEEQREKGNRYRYDEQSDKGYNFVWLSEKEVQTTIKKNKAICLENLELLLKSKIDAIRDRFSPEVAALIK